MTMNKNKLIYRNPVFLIETRFLKLYMLVGFLLRIILMYTAPGDASFTIGETVRLLCIGLLADFGMGILLAVPLQIVYLGLNEGKYHRIAGWVIEVLLAAAFVYVLFFHLPRVWRRCAQDSPPLPGLEAVQLLHPFFLPEDKTGMAEGLPLFRLGGVRLPVPVHHRRRIHLLGRIRSKV